MPPSLFLHVCIAPWYPCSSLFIVLRWYPAAFFVLQVLVQCTTVWHVGIPPYQWLHLPCPTQANAHLSSTYGALHLVTTTLVQVQNQPVNKPHRVSVGAEKLHKVISPHWEPYLLFFVDYDLSTSTNPHPVPIASCQQQSAGQCQ